MLLGTKVQPGNRHFDRTNHLVFVLFNAELHGIERIKPQPYTCECGATLTPDVLDEGDESKTSWPNCKSWRDGGKKKCPKCDEYPSIGRDQHIRARGYEPVPKDNIKDLTQAQRENAIEQAEGECIACDESAAYVVRMVPPRYGGRREPENLAPLCNRHYNDFGQMFADILVPYEWHLVKDISWREGAEYFRDSFFEDGFEEIAGHLDELLERGMPDNPYPYVDA